MVLTSRFVPLRTSLNSIETELAHSPPRSRVTRQVQRTGVPCPFGFPVRVGVRHPSPFHRCRLLPVAFDGSDEINGGAAWPPVAVCGGPVEDERGTMQLGSIGFLVRSRAVTSPSSFVTEVGLAHLYSPAACVARGACRAQLPENGRSRNAELHSFSERSARARPWVTGTVWFG